MGLSSRYRDNDSALDRSALRAAASAEESSLRKTIRIEEAFVRKSRKVSAGRLRERCEEKEVRKEESVARQAETKDWSAGTSGEYQYLYLLAVLRNVAS